MSYGFPVGILYQRINLRLKICMSKPAKGERMRKIIQLPFVYFDRLGKLQTYQPLPKEIWVKETEKT